jgi:hypothetical protein
LTQIVSFAVIYIWSFQAVVLEGKYWKRKLAAVTAEYKKWRMFYRNRIMGWSAKDGNDMVCIVCELWKLTSKRRHGMLQAAGFLVVYN